MQGQLGQSTTALEQKLADLRTQALATAAATRGVGIGTGAQGVPSFQHGGTVTGGPVGAPRLVLAHVGERFYPPGVDTVLQGRQPGEGSRGTVNYHTNITIQNPVLDSPQRVNDLARLLERKIRDLGRRRALPP